MFASQNNRSNASEVMNVESSLISFINRVNDAYMSSHSIRDLINDPEYQKLPIKHGKAHGLPLGNRHLLPGHWFTVFVAPYECFQRVQDALKCEQKERNNAEKTFFGGNDESLDNKEEIMEAADQFKSLSGLNSLQTLIEKFHSDVEFFVNNMNTLDDRKLDTFPSKNSLKRLVTAIASGSYEFSTVDGDLTVAFYDNDLLCGYRFEACIKVEVFNQFATDFCKQLIELLWSIIKNRRDLRKEVSGMFLGQVFLEED